MTALYKSTFALAVIFAVLGMNPLALGSAFAAFVFYYGATQTNKEEK